MKNVYLKAVVLLIVMMTAFASTVYADKGGRDRDDKRGYPENSRGKPPPGYRMDKRYDHNRYFPFLWRGEETKKSSE